MKQVTIPRALRWLAISALLVPILGAPSLADDSAARLGQWQTVPMPPRIEDRQQAIHSALLPDGRVLMVNGSSFRDSMDAHGNIVFGTDVSNYRAVDNATIFDPTTRTYQRLPVPPAPIVDGEERSADIFCAGLIHLTDGRVLLAGGTRLYYPEGMFEGRRPAVLFDWRNDSWVDLPEMRDGRWYPTLMRLSNGQVAVFSGIKHDDKTRNSPLIEIYDPERNRWAAIDMRDVPGSPLNTRLPNGGGIDRIHHYPRLFPFPDGRIFISHDGSGMGNMLSRRTYLLELEFGASGPQARFTPGPERPVTNKVYSAGMIDPSSDRGDFLLSGGQIGAPGLTGPGPYAIPNTEVVAHLERLRFDDRGQGRWELTEDFFGPEVSGPRVMHYMIALPNRQVLIVGGGTYAFQRPIYEPLLLTADEASPGGFRMEVMAPGLQPRLYHNTALLLADGSVLVAGGNANRAIRRSDGGVVLATYTPPGRASTVVEPGQAHTSAEIWQAEIYRPPYLFPEASRPAITRAPTEIIYGETARMAVSNAGVGGSASLISLGAPTHGFDSGQRFAGLELAPYELEGGGVAEVSFRAPDNAHLYPPGYYMLFFVNPSGQPSDAKFVQLLHPEKGTSR